ncbi:MAG: lipoyl(octanoyl) transferase LipB [bacterium]|nr:lipoyl(octanoyl) transferase LipB [bacterium]
MIEWKFSKSPVPYLEAISFMEQRVEEIYKGKSPELIWVLEHPHLYTTGPRAQRAELVDPQDVPIIATGRGGKTTYHGPGQKVIYTLLNLNNRGKDLRHFVWQLEESLIQTLKAFDLQVSRREGRIGLWIPSNMPEQGEEKIAALGIRVRKWVTFHGASLNVSPDLSYFYRIIPCGLEGYGVTSMAQRGLNLDEKDLNQTLKQNFEKVFKE